jgi:phosphatidylinositol 4-kinase
MRESAIQSLLNHFSAPDREGVTRSVKTKKAGDSSSIGSVNGTLSDPQKGVVSANAVHAVSRLALAFGDEQVRVILASEGLMADFPLQFQISRLVASMLLQRLVGSDPIVDGAIMYELSELAYVVEVNTFSDIIKSVYEVSKALKPDDAMSKVVSRGKTLSASMKVK